MSAKTFTISIPDTQMLDLEAAASKEGISVEEFVPLFLDTYLDDYAALRESLERSEKDLEDGRTLSHEDVLARLQSRFEAFNSSEAA